MNQEKSYYNCLRSGDYDHSWYQMAKEMAQDAGVEPSKPRSVTRMMSRPNAPASTVQDYYLRNTYLPLLDHIISELDSQFSGEFTTLHLLNY